jgi:endonuclease-8
MAVVALGPDVLAGDFDPRLAATRAAEHGARRIADVLLDQRVVAGIGNIYKCEALFVAGVDPRTRVGQLDAATLERIYEAAHRLMIANLDPSVRGLSSRGAAASYPPASSAPASGPPPRAASFRVYSRTGKPCTRCGTPIACASLGEPARWTWWCPTCQPDAANRGTPEPMEPL